MERARLVPLQWVPANIQLDNLRQDLQIRAYIRIAAALRRFSEAAALKISELMQPSNGPNPQSLRISEYAAAAALSLLILITFMKLWQADLRVPFCYAADGFLHASFVKSMIDNGWYWKNEFVGAPDGQLLYDFPAVDNLALLSMKLLSLAVPNYAIVANLFFLLSFPLTAITALYAFRQFNISFTSSLFGSQLYAFLPYHFMRNSFGHLFLASYYLVPLVIVVIWWLCSGVFQDDKDIWRFSSKKGYILAAIAICVLVGFSGVYYPFFSSFFLLLTGLCVSLHRKNVRPLLLSGFFVVVISATAAINLAPSLVHIYKHGNIHLTDRNPAEAEVFGLKIAQLILPISGHRIQALANTKWIYNHGPLFNENDTASLGFFGSLGFLALIGWSVYKKVGIKSMSPEDPNGPLHYFSILNLSAVLLATVGGFGSLVAIGLTPQIRSYNRISVFVAFFSLFALVILIDRFAAKHVNSRKRKVVFRLVITIALMLGILDQIGPGFMPDYPQIRSEFANDSEFMSQVQAALPTGAMVFQLPYVAFPESPSLHELRDYELFRGYLHSKTLRWSYGAIKDRATDVWQKRVAEMPVEYMVEALSAANFSGIYLDRRGYADQGAEIIRKLAAVISERPNTSRNGHLVFFSLVNYDQKSQNGSLKHDHHIKVDWLGGFSDLEGTAEHNWRWCSSQGELHLTNLNQEPATVTIEMFIATGDNKNSNLSISSPDFLQKLTVNHNRILFSKTISLSVGTYVMRFESDAKRIVAPGDPRTLVFNVQEFRIVAH
jgi:hypothetical protein